MSYHQEVSHGKSIGVGKSDKPPCEPGKERKKS